MTTVRKLSPSTLKKLLAPFSISNYIYTRPVSNPLHLPFINPPSISQNFTKTPLFAKPFSSQPTRERVTQQLSNYVASGRADKWQSREELAGDNERVRWKRPEEGLVRVNMSVVYCLAPVKLVVYAGMYSHWLRVYPFSFFQIFDSLTGSLPLDDYFAEYLAILKCVELASSEGYLNVVIESVNKEVVDTITEYMKAVKEAPTLTNEPGPDCLEMKFKETKRDILGLIASLVKLVPRGGTYRYVHIHKEANSVVARIAMKEAMKYVEERVVE